MKSKSLCNILKDKMFLNNLNSGFLVDQYLIPLYSGEVRPNIKIFWWIMTNNQYSRGMRS